MDSGEGIQGTPSSVRSENKTSFKTDIFCWPWEEVWFFRMLYMLSLGFTGKITVKELCHVSVTEEVTEHPDYYF